MTGETAVQGQAIAEEGEEVEYIFLHQHYAIIELTKYLGGV